MRFSLVDMNSADFRDMMVRKVPRREKESSLEKKLAPTKNPHIKEIPEE